MKKSFQLTAYALLAILGIIVIIRDGDIIYCTRCGSLVPDLFSTVAVIVGLVGFARTLAAKNTIAGRG